MRSWSEPDRAPACSGLKAKTKILICRFGNAPPGERSLAFAQGLRQTLLMRYALPAAIVLAGALSAASAQTPHPNSIAALLAGPWHHVPDSVGSNRAARDQAKCRMIAGQTPEINDIKFSVVFINCLRAEGYEPGATPNVELHSFASTKFDDYSCADISRLKKKSANVDLLFFAWARGFISGWNLSAEKAILKVDPTVMDPDEQLKFIRAFCEANPSKLYTAAVIELLAKLKYEKSSRTGKIEE